MMQIAKNLTDPIDGFLRDKRLLIIAGFRQPLARTADPAARLP